MNIGQQILFLVSALGAFNGIILSLYLFFSKKYKSTAALFLGMLVLTISIRVAKSVFLYFNPQIPKIYLQIGLSACFLIGPALYFFIKSVQTNTTRIPTAWKWHWGILSGILLLGGIAVPYQTYPDTWNNTIVYIIYGQWLLYLIATGILLKNAVKKGFALWVFAGNCIIFLVYLLALFGVVRGMYISGAVSFSFFLYLTVFFYLHRVLPIRPAEPANKPEKRKIAESDAQTWIEKLGKAIRDKQLYKDPNLKLSDLAREINITAHQLSQLLNDNLGKSFSTYINEYRINEACQLITTHDRLTFEAIGYEVGYNSKSTFYTAFKKIKDTTPALFKENIEKMNAK